MTGLVTIAGIPLWEGRSVEQDSQKVSVAGRESITDRRGLAAPPLTAAQVQAAHDNVTQLAGLVVPVVFSDKLQFTGFYRVTDSSSRLTKFANGSVQDATWQATLERLGGGRDVEIESRVPTVGRLRDHAVTPVFWHAPAVGATTYWTGSTVPAGSVSRASADGAVVVHTGIPAGVAPRWTVPVDGYLLGSARLTVDGQRRVGTITPAPASVVEGFGTAPFGVSAFGGAGVPVWQVDNGLVRLTAAASGAFEVACWDAGQWRSAKSWQVTVNGAALTATPEFTVLRNDPEEVTVRLGYPTTVGRVTVDLGLRRGSRFVTGVLKRHASAALGVVRASEEAGAAETGRLRANANDGDGNRYVIGSARTYTADTASGGISKAGVTALDFFVGHAVDGSGAAPGDTPGDLLAQYLGGAGGERVRVVRR